MLHPKTILRSYEVTRLLRSGGTADIYEAQHLASGQPVALKVVRDNVTDRSAAGRSLLREARLLGILMHDGVVRAFDGFEDGAAGAVAVLERLEGESLADRMARVGPIPLAVLHGLGIELWKALAAIHARGFIHACLKPSNLFIERQSWGPPRVKLLDFSHARQPGATLDDLKEIAHARGSGFYIAPEQTRAGESLDGRTDVYSACTVLFEALSGVLPVAASGEADAIALKARAPARRLSEVMARVGPDVSAFLERGLARDPQDRFITASDALRSWSKLERRAPSIPRRSRRDDDSLVDDVRANPDSDEPRLVYADYLSSRGDPLGDLIAVQCELARLGCSSERPFRSFMHEDALADRAALEDGRVARLRADEAALLAAHRGQWTEGVAPFAAEGGVHLRRGFVEHVVWDVKTALDDGFEQLVAAAPLLRSVELGSDPRPGSQHGLRAFFDSHALAQLHELALRGLDLQALELLADSARMEALRRLCLTAADPLPLLRATWLERIDQCVLHRGTHAEAVLAIVSRLDRPRELQVIDTALFAEGTKNLFAATSAERLEILALRGARLGRGATERLVDAPMPALRAIDLASNGLGPEDGPPLARLLPRLFALDVSSNAMGTRGLTPMLEAADISSLRSLSLHATGLDDTTVPLLLGTRHLAALDRLQLGGNAFSEGAVAQLAEALPRGTFS